jgi:PDZ domain-containing secreted protein
MNPSKKKKLLNPKKISSSSKIKPSNGKPSQTTSSKLQYLKKKELYEKSKLNKKEINEKMKLVKPKPKPKNLPKHTFECGCKFK